MFRILVHVPQKSFRGGLANVHAIPGHVQGSRIVAKFAASAYGKIQQSPSCSGDNRGAVASFCGNVVLTADAAAHLGW